MTDLELSFLGSGNAFATGGLCWNGFMVDRRYLFESPPQALMSLNRLGHDANDLDAVILSHHHGDHFLGIPFLFLHWKYGGRTRPVSIIGPPGTEDVVRSLCNLAFPGEFNPRFPVNWVDVEPGAPVSVGDLELEAVAMKHDPRLALSLGFHARLHGRRFAYTGDSAMCDSVLGLALSAEVLVTECASRTSRVPVHMNLVDDMPIVRAALPTSSTLVLTHIEAGTATGDLANTFVAQDFETYRV